MTTLEVLKKIRTAQSTAAMMSRQINTLGQALTDTQLPVSDEEIASQFVQVREGSMRLYNMVQEIIDDLTNEEQYTSADDGIGFTG